MISLMIASGDVLTRKATPKVRSRSDTAPILALTYSPFSTRCLSPADKPMFVRTWSALGCALAALARQSRPATLSARTCNHRISPHSLPCYERDAVPGMPVALPHGYLGSASQGRQ